uniref:Uncharacterized protein n=1 Tax=Amphimedon queenslandica TaxID=400682 RepID=A0A1X7VF36_AMPQE
MEIPAMVSSTSVITGRLSTPLPKQEMTMESVPKMPQLAVWSISGKDSMNKVFQAKPQTSSSVHGGQKQKVI